MISPLTSVALFHLGPVPVTAGVVVTWAIMAVLVLGGILVTRHLSLVPSATQAAFELVVDTVDTQIRTMMQSRACSLPCLYRHVVRFHIRRQLVVASAGHRTAHGSSRDRCRARAPRLCRRDLVRYSCGRRARLSRHLCLAQSDHDPAQFRREVSHARSRCSSACSAMS